MEPNLIQQSKILIKKYKQKQIDTLVFLNTSVNLFSTCLNTDQEKVLNKDHIVQDLFRLYDHYNYSDPVLKVKIPQNLLNNIIAKMENLG